MNYSIIDKIIYNALNEDITNEDITTNSIIPLESLATVDLIIKNTGVIAGLNIFKRVFDILGEVEVTFNEEDGNCVSSGKIVGNIRGNARNILTGERTALNLLQKMSGIATLTDKYCKAVHGTSAKIVDTRKTTPGLRILEKYAVKIGGGSNHRFNLSDGILIKDNHIGAAGSVKEAIKLAKINTSFVKKVEVEAENFDMVVEALNAGADIIMLDNMSTDMMKKAVTYIDKKVITEASGNVNLKTVTDIALTGVDLISVGNITHSAPILDFSMKNMKIIK
ncbi:MAG: carboxylating nicotinate-nucleotide diphosphorylase [Eubacteriaceae bacterium]